MWILVLVISEVLRKVLFLTTILARVMDSLPAITTMTEGSIIVTTCTQWPRTCWVAGSITTSVARPSLRGTRGQPVLSCPGSLIGRIHSSLHDTQYLYWDRYFGTQRRTDYLGSVSSGGSTDFRHYNYRRVPYLGGSDHFSYLNRTVLEAQMIRGVQ